MAENIPATRRSRSGSGLRYSMPLIALHWSIGAISIGLIIAGFILSYAPFPSESYDSLHFWHRSFGTLIVPLTLLMLYRRMTGPPPPLQVPRWQRLLAALTKTVTYMLLIAIPLTKLYRGAFGLGFDFFGLTLSAPFPPDKPTAVLTGNLHYYLSMSLIAILILHVSAAAWHNYIKNDSVVARMLPKSSAE
ncbi:cytochrome b [Chelatococcus asaccharovorans]|uniref:Cytochrome b561 n=1 Tax=Chelatococcus asaccharovorans TaxID=28210 RepID=A0A2V3UJG4_9HYPH|nr:cytochrome b/b6 domain-containing protein [Chelatococcus asaccharovorans]MBS7701858.1 cytochrome b [Chelatococcus asaccharovorans]PXW64434.1 cytochrome b561 [Chelatococcus asaccharovorans]CAH1665965.1 Cytochrome b561 [Chelatococcus asaccharovorans]CAH1681696.1 Cytochrome b561 [Chelatococcus asaccharovorans]